MHFLTSRLELEDGILHYSWSNKETQTAFFKYYETEDCQRTMEELKEAGTIEGVMIGLIMSAFEAGYKEAIEKSKTTK